MPRTFKFKAWNKEEKLLIRLNAIDCYKGVLEKKGHILLPFTGLFDKNGAEIYEYDILLYDTAKWLIIWDEDELCWARKEELQPDSKIRVYKVEIAKCLKLCNYYESPESFAVINL